MFNLEINSISEAQFLSEYWQKKPLLIKGGFKDFIDPIEPEELAGLAMESDIESRLITNHQDNWQSYHGPFEDFSLLTDSNSTLLVQAVDHWHPAAAELLEPFRFIPNWRIDDLMISYSTPSGGVGPHLDQYDVFIIQGQGKRHWRVGMPDTSLKEIEQNNSLLQVEQFEAVIDHILESGDILYIPPGCPHEGYALENALNYSVGFRAPDTKDFLSNFSDYLIDNNLGKKRYSDADLKPRNACGHLQASEVKKIQTLMIDAINDSELISNWLSQYLSQPKHDMDILPLDIPISPDELSEYIRCKTIVRAGGIRIFYQTLKEYLIVSVNGDSYTLPLANLVEIEAITEKTSFQPEQISNALGCVDFTKMLTKLINEGLFYLENEV